MRSLIPLYIALATLLERRKNLARRDTLQKAMLDAVEDEIDRLVKEHMPSDSGFDCGVGVLGLGGGACLGGFLLVDVCFGSLHTGLGGFFRGHALPRKRCSE